MKNNNKSETDLNEHEFRSKLVKKVWGGLGEKRQKEKKNKKKKKKRRKTMTRGVVIEKSA